MKLTDNVHDLTNNHFSRWRTRILLLMLLMGSTVFSITLYESIMMHDINKQWHAFELGRNEKAQYISSIVQQMGYGGMIHHYKDYLLRGEPQYHDAMLEDIGSVLLPIRRYHTLATSRAEFDSLNVIENILLDYRNALIEVESGWEQGLSIKDIDTQVRIDDTLALKALTRLSKLARPHFDDDDPIQRYLKAYEQLHTAMGYGGLIHSLKNYVLRADKTYLNNFQNELALAREALSDLNKFGPNKKNNSENLEIDILAREAITDIETTLAQYEDAIKHAQELQGQQQTPDKIDSIIRFDNKLALGALDILRRYLSERLNQSSQRLNDELNTVRTFGSLSPVILLLILLSLTGAMIWLGRIDKAQRQSLESEIENKVEAEQKFKQLSEELDSRVKKRTKELSKQVEERQTAEAALIESEQRIKGVLNSAADAIITADGNGTIKIFNQAAENLFKCSGVDAIEQSLDKFLPFINNNNIGWEKALKRASFKSRNGERIINEIKAAYKTIVEVSISEITQANHSEFTIIARDITEQTVAQQTLENTVEQLEEAQDSLIESEKMAALGNLVAGISHEINTPVGVSVTAVSHLAEHVDNLKEKHESNTMSRADFQQFLNTASESSSIIQSNLLRASELIRSFKQVAVDQSSDEKRAIDLKTYLDEVISSLRPQLKKTGHQIDLSCDITHPIEIYPGSLSQIISNLIINSTVHGYDEGKQGLITITATEYNNHIELVYTDDGKGIPAENLGKIFDPFFTTRRGSGGSGLGLHIIYNLITQKLDGTITCKSQEGEGVTFEIQFPAKLSEASLPQRLAS